MGAPAQSTVLSSAPETNVVKGAVERLKAVFASRGFGAETSKRKMHAATDMLLNGISAESLSPSGDSYSELNKPISVVLADADLALRHVDQTRNAAEIYLDLVDADKSVEEELESLQVALLVSERALVSFRQSLPEDKLQDIGALEDAVDALRVVTDRFGDRVRQSHLQPSDSASKDS